MPEIDQTIEADRVRIHSDIQMASKKGREASDALAKLAKDPDLARLRANAVLERDGAKEALAKAEKAETKRREDYSRMTETAEAALKARRMAESELLAFYGVHADYFGQFAEEKTQAAHEALLEVQVVYERARAAWQAATSAWDPIHRGLGQVGEQQIGFVGQFPSLTEDVFSAVREGRISARPPGVVIERHEPEVIEG